MSDIKRTFMAGLLVAGILLLMPFYFNLIGYNNVSSDTDKIDPPKKTQEEVEPADVLQEEKIVLQGALSSGVPEKEYIISNNKFTAVLSNLSGGSLLSYELNQSITQF